MIRVLIVDDDKLARKGLISIMPWSSHGMVVVGEAANGAKALEFLEENAVDLMFVDISMPFMTGIELIQECKKRYSDIQFVVLTFREDFEYVQTAFRLGALDYISKVQLEIDNYDETFERILQKLKASTDKSGQVPSQVQYLGVTTEASLSSTLYEEKWPGLEDDWCRLHWLYDETAFEGLCTQTQDLNPPARRLHDLFLRVILQIEGTTHIDVGSDIDIIDVRLAIEWIHQYRDALYKHVSQLTDSTETSICILKAVIFIRENIGKSLHAEMVADYVNMSRGYFSQCFKKLVGQTFNSYLRKERIRIAAQLLQQSNHSISSIARTVGYGDVKYFSHIFHEEMNMLPSEYRLKLNKGDK